MKTTPKAVYYRNRKPKGAMRVTWTPSMVEQALRLATQGDLRLLADFAQQVAKDDRVGGCMETRVGTIAGLPLTWEHENPAVVEAISEDWPVLLPEQVLTAVQWWGDMLGVVVSSYEPVLSRSGRWLPVVDVWHPRNLLQRGGSWRIRTEDGERLVIPENEWWVYQPYGEEPWEWALIQPLAELWLQARFTDLDWTTWSERHGRPTPIGTAPAMAPETDLDGFEADIKATVQGGGSLVVREGYRLDYAEPKNESWRGFEARLNSTHERMAVRLLGQNLTTVVRGGSLAATNIHDQVRLGVLKSMVEKLSTALQQGPLRWWYEWNFGVGTAPYPRWNLSRQLTTVEQAKADTAVFAAVKAAREVNAPLDERAYYAERGVLQ